MPNKYPCGACATSVRYKALLCTGPCNKWFHSKCLNVADKMFKQLKIEEIEKWKCPTCTATPQSQSMQHVEEKIKNLQNQQEPDLETSLTLAAEVGNTLLVENEKLKQSLEQIKLENLKLTTEINQIKNTSNVYYEAQIEKLEEEKETILQRNLSLLETVNETDRQLEKEFKLREELTRTFEDHDKKNGEIIHKYEEKIKHLQEEMTQLKTNKYMVTHKLDSQKNVKNTETQTYNSESPADSAQNALQLASNKFLLTELAKLKSGQDNIENIIQLSNSTVIWDIAQIKIRQGQIESLIKDMKDQAHPSDTPKPKMKKLNKSVLKPYTASSLTPENKHRQVKHGKNYFSISLQARKYREECEITDSQPQQQREQSLLLETRPTLHKNKFQVTISPPITAVRRDPSESLQTFYDRSIKQVLSESSLSKNLNIPRTRLHPNKPLKEVYQRDPNFFFSANNQATSNNIAKPKKMPLPQPAKFTIFHQNINGLGSKIDRLNHELKLANPTMVVLTEHGLSKDKLINTRLDNYEYVGGFSRLEHRKGGVAIYAKKNLGNEISCIDITGKQIELGRPESKERLRITGGAVHPPPR
ncbi:hypothetical protein J6590_059992 [Homalodisca vitripennis]|nr:hypothetical protein J6590_059992 [Homalodisca vitripennis]